MTRVGGSWVKINQFIEMFEGLEEEKKKFENKINNQN